MALRTLNLPALVLCLSDFAAVFGSCILAFFLRHMTGGELSLEQYTATVPWVAVFPLFYLLLGLYPGTFLRKPEELKRLCIATSLGCMTLVLFSFLTKGGHNYSRLALLLAWVLAVFAVPAARYITRTYCREFSWWAVPCILFGNNKRIPELCAALASSEKQGLRTALLVLDEDAPLPTLEEKYADISIKRISLTNMKAARAALNDIAHDYPRSYAVVAFGGSDDEKRQIWLNVIDQCFQRIIVIPDLLVGGRTWLMAVSIGRFSGIMLRQNLLDPRRMLLKRSMDLLLTLLGGIFVFPLLFALALAIRLGSPGPALFRQTRLGRGGKPFDVYKFRTMALNSAELLEKHMAENPEARQEWSETQKLKNDPRVTKIGHFLRKTSLDELPQLINVLKGEMSLVGPRPIVSSEVERYGDDYEIYTRVRPGITGLWQVSGRNDVSYAERVRLDKHYVYNWSVWMDIVIVVRTVPEVLCGSGAY